LQVWIFVFVYAIPTDSNSYQMQNVLAISNRNFKFYVPTVYNKQPIERNNWWHTLVC